MTMWSFVEAFRALRREDERVRAERAAVAEERAEDQAAVEEERAEDRARARSKKVERDVARAAAKGAKAWSEPFNAERFAAVLSVVSWRSLSPEQQAAVEAPDEFAYAVLRYVATGEDPARQHVRWRESGHIGTLEDFAAWYLAQRKEGP